MKSNILILGPKCSGKTTFIYTLLNIKKKPTITIGADMFCYKYSNNNIIYFWDIGNGLHYTEIIYSLLSKVNTIIIIENNNTIDFISQTISFINNYNIKNLIIIFNMNENSNKFNKKQIESLNSNITFNIFYINCNNFNEVTNISKFIEKNIIL
tara:strand:+ start:494 stop:955 length:462 start_codon:yes stop_codon:yes gene_type:complete